MTCCMPDVFRDWRRDQGPPVPSLDELHSSIQPAETGLPTRDPRIAWIQRAARDGKVFYLKVIRIHQGKVLQVVQELMGAFDAGSAAHQQRFHVPRTAGICKGFDCDFHADTGGIP